MQCLGTPEIGAPAGIFKPLTLALENGAMPSASIPAMRDKQAGPVQPAV
jgi:hypothetical protein